MILARPDERETCLHHFSLRLFSMIRRSLCGPIACWILPQISSLLTWSLYESRTLLLSSSVRVNGNRHTKLEFPIFCYADQKLRKQDQFTRTLGCSENDQRYWKRTNQNEEKRTALSGAVRLRLHLTRNHSMSDESVRIPFIS